MKDLRIAHMADSHLGYRARFLADRDVDFAHSWISACHAIVASEPDLIVHAGDVFHQSQPSWGAVSAFLKGVEVLREADVPIIMIAGNHDSSRLLMKHTAFSVIQQIVPAVTVVHESTPVQCSLPELKTDVVAVPHRALLNPNLNDLLKAIIDDLNPVNYNVLVAHGDIHASADTQAGELGSVAIPASLFEFPWSYAALGHLHMAQPFGTNGWYSGSIERCGWSDYLAEPGWTSVIVSKTKPIRHSRHVLPHLTMYQFLPLDCNDLSDGEIVKQVVAMVDQQEIPVESVVVRVILRRVSMRRKDVLRRAIQKDLKARNANLIFQLDIESEQTFIWGPDQLQSSDVGDRRKSIEEMFKDFVASRDYPQPGFKQRFLTRGLERIQDAQADEALGDLGDERTVPVE